MKSDNDASLQAALQEPFGEEDLEWRIQRGGVKNGRPWAMVVPYVAARAVAQRLDDVFGVTGWSDHYAQGPQGGVMCTIAVEGCSKSDAAENTEIEPVKGGISDAFKRAAVKFGIGRYLYRINGTLWANVHEGGSRQGVVKDDSGKKHYFKWDPPSLPDHVYGGISRAPEPAKKATPKKKPAKKEAAPSPDLAEPKPPEGKPPLCKSGPCEGQPITEIPLNSWLHANRQGLRDRYERGEIEQDQLLWSEYLIDLAHYEKGKRK